jgi:hypothetical protein
MPTFFPSFGKKLIKIGARVVSHSRYVAFQMAEVAIPTNLFSEILRLIALRSLQQAQLLSCLRSPRDSSR